MPVKSLNWVVNSPLTAGIGPSEKMVDIEEEMHPHFSNRFGYHVTEPYYNVYNPHSYHSDSELVPSPGDLTIYPNTTNVMHQVYGQQLPGSTFDSHAYIAQPRPSERDNKVDENRYPDISLGSQPRLDTHPQPGCPHDSFPTPSTSKAGRSPRFIEGNEFGYSYIQEGVDLMTLGECSSSDPIGRYYWVGLDTIVCPKVESLGTHHLASQTSAANLDALKLLAKGKIRKYTVSRKRAGKSPIAEGEVWKCGIQGCESECSSERSLNRHQQNKHRSEEMYVAICLYGGCGSRRRSETKSTAESNLSIHQREKHPLEFNREPKDQRCYTLRISKDEFQQLLKLSIS
ncbi:hypothetical protein TWF788_004670 [Orbilia oligospora]|uniref:C2H2-type domain-containing protein n=1 Tax=Orbilia oligospora TaxID=2813651 RepID=A0A7C8U938_ORBOL|nr:hypothetical protein TWF788_004670 [Orbilia oligospora]